MNQILAVENDPKNKKKKKNTTADIKKVITVFCVITDVNDAILTKKTTLVIKNSPKNIGKNVILNCECK